jgi:hypothetical protein
MKNALFAGIALLLTACSSTGNGAIKTLSPAALPSAVEIGKSTQADVRAFFGEAKVRKFDNGYEIWIYQDTEQVNRAILYVPVVGLAYRAFDHFSDAPKELEILFDRNGVVKKYAFKDGAI